MLVVAMCEGQLKTKEENSCQKCELLRLLTTFLLVFSYTHSGVRL